MNYNTNMLKRNQRSLALRQSGLQVEYAGTSALFDLEQGLPGYNNDVVKKLAKGLGVSDFNKDQTVVEFGAGTGALAEIWDAMFGAKPICVEIDPKLFQILEHKKFKVVTSLEQINFQVPLIYTSNVLEHIEHDVKALMEIKNKIKPGGKLAIYVPALPMLFSDLDRSVGHFRRYRKRELEDKVTQAGFKIQECYYNDCLGVLASLFLKIFGYKNKAGLGSKKSLIFYDKLIYPVSIYLDRLFFKFLLGKNIILIAINEEN